MKKYIFLFVLISTCAKVEIDTIDNLNDGTIGIIGHGGIGFPSLANDLPPNSFNSLQKAVDVYQANGVEVDVQLTKDHELVLFHDVNLVPASNCEGCIKDYTLEELEQCVYRVGGDSLISLREIVDYFSTYSPKPQLFLDIELNRGCWNDIEEADLIEILAVELLEIINDYNATDWIFIEPNNLTLARNLLEKNEEIKLSWLADLSEQSIQFAKAENFWGIVLSNDEATTSAIQNAHNNGLFVSLYNVKIRSAAVDAINKQADFIQTDNILLLKEILD